MILLNILKLIKFHDSRELDMNFPNINTCV